MSGESLSQGRRSGDSRIGALEDDMSEVAGALQEVSKNTALLSERVAQMGSNMDRIADSMSKLVEVQVGHEHLRNRVDRMEEEYHDFRLQTTDDISNYKADRQSVWWVIKAVGVVLLAAQVLFGSLITSQVSDIHAALKDLPLLQQRMAAFEKRSPP